MNMEVILLNTENTQSIKRGRNKTQSGGRGGQGACGRDRKRDGNGPHTPRRNNDK